MIELLQTVAKLVIDTIAKQVVDKPTSETLEILSKVNEFYDSAWSKLIFLLAGAFAVLGIIMPFVIQHFQTKALKASEKELENKVNLQIIELKKDLMEALDKKLEEQVVDFKNDLEKKIEKINANTNASAFHMQGNDSLDKQNYKEAVRDYCVASTNYQLAEDLVNLKATLSGLSFCADFLKKDDLAHLENIESIKVLELLDRIGTNDLGGAFTRDIRKIKAKIYKVLNSEEKQEENIDEHKEE